MSFVIPAYNCDRFVAATLESVRRQTFEPWECVVVDDGSDDGTPGVVDRFASDPRMHVQHQPNRGMCPTRNIGFGLTSPEAEYLVFLDADDVLEPEFLDVMVQHMDAHPDVGLAYCSFRPVDPDGRVVPGFEGRAERTTRGRGLRLRSIPPQDPRCPLDALVAGHWAIPSCSIIRRTAYASTTGWDEAEPRLSDDQDMVFQIARAWDVHFIPRELVAYLRHDSNVSNTGAVARDRRTRRRWWDAEPDDPVARERMRRSIVFDARVSGQRQIGAALRELRRREPRTAVIHLLRGGRALADATVLEICRRLDAGWPARWLELGRQT